MNFKVIQISPGIFRLESFFSNSKFLYMKKIIENLPFERKDNGKNFKYGIFLFSENKNIYFTDILFSKIQNEINKLKKFSEKIYNIENLLLNQMGAVMKLQKEDYITYHTDDHSTIQGVIHFSDGYNDKDIGGNLLIVDNLGKIKELIPKENSIILFKGTLSHSVEKYNLEKDRYSISFGFSNKKNLEKNKERFNKKVKNNLDIIPST